MKFELRVGQITGAIPWIPSALSTLKPATSPRLSTIRLDFAGPFISTLHAERFIKDLGDDLRRIADEVGRIEREFGGTVNFTVLRDSVFGAVLDTLDVSIRSRDGRDFVVVLNYLGPPLPDPSGPPSLKWGDCHPMLKDPSGSYDGVIATVPRFEA